MSETMEKDISIEEIEGEENSFDIEKKLQQLDAINKKESVIKQFDDLESEYGDDGVELASMFLNEISEKDKLENIYGYINFLDDKGGIEAILQQDKGKILTFFNTFYDSYLSNKQQEQETKQQEQETKQQEQETNKDRRKDEEVDKKEEEQKQETEEQKQETEKQKQETEKQKQEILEGQEQLNKAIKELQEGANNLSEKFGMDENELKDKAQQRQEAIQKASENSGQEISDEQAFAIAYSGVVKENIPAEHQNDAQVQEFLGDYDKISAALGVEETLQSAEYVSQSNESYENFRDSTDTSNIEGKQQAEEKFGKDFVENQLTEGLSSIAFKEGFQNFKDILGDNINYVSNFSDMENFSLEDGMSLKMNVKGTELDLGFEGGNATITDYLPDGKTFEGKEKSLSISGNMITPNQLKDRLTNEINISDIAKNSSDQNDFNQNLQKRLEEKSQEILSSQKTDLIKADLDYEIERAEKYTQILDFYQPPGSFDNFLDKQEPKETISSSSGSKYEFLDVVRNTINNNSISDVEYIANGFEQIKNYEPRDGDRQIVKDLVNDFDNRDTSSFMNFINEFSKTDELGNKVLDMEQFQNFVESLNDIGKNYERENYRPDAHVDKISQIRKEEERQKREEDPDEILKEKEDLFV